MDFFEQQHQARRHTALMLVLFFVAVAAIVAVIDLIGTATYAWTNGLRVVGFTDLFAQVPRVVHIATTAVTLGVIAFGTALRLWDLSAGGVAVAEMVGARRVERDSRDVAERRLLNIVEEMALASGITVPLVYVMDKEHTINAFAAGYSPNEAVVTVTHGALERLTRDELQGVIGHEFSHILNGDMRLNLRLMGVIAGIVLIGSLGQFFMRIASGGGERNRGADPRPFVLGLALWIVGSIGVLAGRIIKAAIARQREFLADAASVQFTRNPDGICGALYKIGADGALIVNRRAEDMSHMYFGEALDYMLGALRTHPPVQERIERILGPGAQWLVRDRVKRAAASPTPPPTETSPVVPEFVSPLYARAAEARPAGGDALGRAASDVVRTTAQAVVASAGRPSDEHVDFARRILDSLPADLRAATRTPDGARAALYALLLGDGAIRPAQLGMVGDPALAARAGAFADVLAKLDPRACMPLVGLLVPTLKVLAPGERDAILQIAQRLAEADHKVTLHEFALLTLLRRHLGADPKGPPPVRHANIADVAKEATLVLSLLAHAGGSGMPAFDKGMAALGLEGGVLRAPAELNLAAVESSLRELNLLAPLRKPLFIKACLEVVMADGKLTVAEGELMRAICAALDTPLPPILDAPPQAAIPSRSQTPEPEYASEERHAT